MAQKLELSPSSEYKCLVSSHAMPQTCRVHTLREIPQNFTELHFWCDLIPTKVEQKEEVKCVQTQINLFQHISLP